MIRYIGSWVAPDFHKSEQQDLRVLFWLDWASLSVHIICNMLTASLLHKPTYLAYPTEVFLCLANLFQGLSKWNFYEIKCPRNLMTKNLYLYKKNVKQVFHVLSKLKQTLNMFTEHFVSISVSIFHWEII